MRHKYAVFCLFFFLLFLTSPSLRAQDQAENQDIVVLQFLDKITARISTKEVPVGKITSFGSLHIRARTCRKAPPEEPPESAAFLQIWEVKKGEAPSWVFSGWMFASSPALSAIEHAVYDIWVLDCKTPSVQEAPVS